jgi:hypothetical protein
MNTKLLLAIVSAFFFNGLVVAEVKIDGKTMDYDNDAHYQDYLRWLIVDPSKHNDAIFTNGTVAQIKANLEHPVRKEIFTKKKASTEAFVYATLDDAKKNWTMRILTISYMQRMNGDENPKIKFSYYELDKNPIPGSDKWELGNPTKIYFKVKMGQPSYEAIEDLILKDKEVKCECAGAVASCVLCAASQVLEKDAFNTLHPPGSLALGPTSWSKHIYKATDGTTHIPGDKLTMVNSDYTAQMAKMKKKGYWHNENTFYVGNSKYSGLGAQLGNLTEEKLRERLAAGYKADVGKAPDNPDTTIKWSENHFRLKVK